MKKALLPIKLAASAAIVSPGLDPPLASAARVLAHPSATPFGTFGRID
jgi:hypothetical protein